MYMKFSNIFSGKLNGMTKPIPAEHLYDMWCRKSQYLNKVYLSNVSKGKNMNTVYTDVFDLNSNNIANAKKIKHIADHLTLGKRLASEDYYKYKYGRLHIFRAGQLL